MSRIAILSDTLASQVAAGEVVERPASVLKELIENSLDAAASHIEVEVRKGGVALLKVADNGYGMDRENAVLSIERHATSKLSSTDGLKAILTHGFRGEALPSIASVARFRMVSNNDTSTAATEVVVEGGKVLGINEVARAQGTTIEVKDIFYNVPARRKFLKSETTEYAHIEHVIKLSALGNSEVRYTFKNNGRVVWDLKPSGDRRTRIADIAGHRVLDDLIEVLPYDFNGQSVAGYLLPGRLARGSSRSQTVFINGRPIDDPVIKAAIREGYRGQVQPGQFPVVWLWMTMPPETIDVNVHPAKREVRFARPSEVKHLIIESIAKALSPKKQREATAPPKFLNTLPEAKEAVEIETQITPTVTPVSEKPAFRLSKEWSTPDQEEMSLQSAVEPTVESTKVTPEPITPAFALIGSLKGRYWLMEDDAGMVVMDPKAARSRISYEALRRAYTENTLSSQVLLIPLVIELDGHDQVTLKKHLPTLHELGVEITSLGGNTFQVQSLPSILEVSESGDAENFVLGVIDELESSNATPKSAQAREQALERLTITLAEQSAQTQSTDPQFALSLVAELMMCDLPYCTATGKPTMTHYALSEITKKFS